ncbi:MAG: DUF4911 domain-containing protein [Candidatus Electrothrix sp. AUS1_2]|nr:DUF4911 domain-containing protein [Candidatus Electrothrix sp. AUS1_2]
MPHSRCKEVGSRHAVTLQNVSDEGEAMYTFYLRIRSDRIALFRFLLEGYDGLAVLSTMDAKDGVVRLIVPASRYTELWDLLFAICEDLCPGV